MDVAVPDNSRMREASRAFWPVAAQRLLPSIDNEREFYVWQDVCTPRTEVGDRIGGSLHRVEICKTVSLYACKNSDNFPLKTCSGFLDVLRIS